MKKFLYYFRIVSRLPQSKSIPVVPIISAAFIYFISVFLSGANGWAPIIAASVFGFGIALFCTCYGSPNLEAVFPVSHGKKLLYRFMSVLLMFVLFIATLFAVSCLIFLIVCIFVPSTLSEVGSDVKNMFEQTGLYGGLFSVAYFIILYAAGMITGFLKRRKARNIFLICLCVALFLAYFFMGLPYYNSINNSEHTFAGPFSSACYAAMALPWLAIVFWFVIAAGITGAAIYLGVKHYDPKKF